MKFKTSTRLRLDSKKVQRLVGRAAQQALMLSGAIVQEKAQDQMSNRNDPKTVRQAKVGERDGRPLVSLYTRVSKPDKVTSWKTSKHPKGRLRSSVTYDYDTRTKSVVIGPEEPPKINGLHEFGGHAKTYFRVTNDGPKRSRKFKNPLWGQLTDKAGPGTINLGPKRVKKRPYMKPGLDKSMRRIPQQFRDRLGRSGK